MNIFDSILEAFGIVTVSDLMPSSIRSIDISPGMDLSDYSIPKNSVYHSDQIKPVKYDYTPQTLNEYIGQENAKSRINTYIKKVMKIKPVHLIINGTRGCFVAGTKVQLADYTWKNIEQIKTGDLLMGFDEHNTRYLKPTKVLNIMKRFSKELVFVKSDFNKVLTTPEHPFLFSQNKQNYFREIGKINQPKKKKLYNIPVFERTKSWERGWLMGVLLGDGSFARHKSTIQFYNKDIFLINKFKEIFISVYKYNKINIYKKENGVFHIYIYHVKLTREFKHTKRDILKNIKRFGSDYLRGFMAGFYEADGGFDKTNKRIELTNTNKNLLKSLEYIFNKFSFLYFNKTIKMNFEKIHFFGYKSKKQCYRLITYRVAEFYSIFQPFTKIHYVCLKNIKTKQTLQKVLKFKNIRNIQKIFKKEIITGEVYNLTTVTGTYIANGFPVHNCGKSTLIYIIAKMLGCIPDTYVGGSFTIDNLHSFLKRNAQDNQLHILFIDEIHALNREVSEYMLPLLQSFILPEGNKKVKPFILMGATTNLEILQKSSQPFLDRCDILELEHYSAQDIKQMLKNYNDRVYQKNISEDVYDLLSQNMRFNPRTSLSAFDDFIIEENVQTVLNGRQIVKNGLTTKDILVLRHLAEIKKPVGIDVLAVITQSTRETYKDLQEPFILQMGYISRTSRGRILTIKGEQLLQELK
jgi:Holliday junction DNA helicase RuvB